ncbi:MAG TPA: DUF881 domain-containing protein [Nocardioides sp.]|uniref:DUF881 domain-containing protein n=1 Tax=Nocardioides sp. TaxID=35761 RepID=UPI002ED86868
MPETRQPSQPHEPGPPAEPGRDRLWRAFRKPRRGQAVVGLLLALLGFAAVTQVRTADDDASYAGYREQDLIDVLNGLAGTTQRAQAELQRLERARDDLRSDTLQRQVALEEARTQVDTLNILAGRVPVSGPGIRVTISERTSEVSVDAFIDLVQELRSIGAEAIEVNDEVRLVAQSAFDEGEGGLLIHGRLVEPPYVVEAIGEPATLAGAVTFARGPQDAFENDGATVRVEELTTVRIRSIAGEDGAAGAGPSSGGDGGQ